MDASAIIQNDAKVENIRAHDRFHSRVRRVFLGEFEPAAGPPPAWSRGAEGRAAFLGNGHGTPRGLCEPWERHRRDLPPIPGDEAIVKRVWEDIDSLANVFIWQILLSF